MYFFFLNTFLLADFLVFSDRAFHSRTPNRENEFFRDRSFFMREGGWWDLGGGALEKNWLERGGPAEKK